MRLDGTSGQMLVWPDRITITRLNHHSEPTLRLGPGTSYPNPYAVPALRGAEQVGDVLSLVTVALSAAAVVSLVLRYRAAPDDVHFSRDPNQREVRRDPIVRYVSVPRPPDGSAYLLAGTVALTALFGRLRRRWS